MKLSIYSPTIFTILNPFELSIYFSFERNFHFIVRIKFMHKRINPNGYKKWCVVVNV